METRNIEVDFLGHRIAVKTEGDAESVQEIIALATRKIQDAKERTPSAAPHQVAVLALLDMAEEYVKAKRRVAEHRSLMDSKAAELASLYEAELGASS